MNRCWGLRGGLCVVAAMALLLCSCQRQVRRCACAGCQCKPSITVINDSIVVYEGDTIPTSPNNPSNEFVVLLDNGHDISDRRGGIVYYDTIDHHGSKRIVKKDFCEGRNTRKLVSLIKPMIEEAGYKVLLVAPEKTVPRERLCYEMMDKKDILHLDLADSTGFFNNTRINRINRWCRQYGADHCVVLSIHTNASDGLDHSGWCVTYGVDPKRMTGGNRELAKVMLKTMHHYGFKFAHRVLYEQDLRVTDYSNCPAVISECFYHDNLEDMRYLDRNWKRVARANADGIIAYIKSRGY